MQFDPSLLSFIRTKKFEKPLGYNSITNGKSTTQGFQPNQKIKSHDFSMNLPELIAIFQDIFTDKKWMCKQCVKEWFINVSNDWQNYMIFANWFFSNFMIFSWFWGFFQISLFFPSLGKVFFSVFQVSTIFPQAVNPAT